MPSPLRLGCPPGSKDFGWRVLLADCSAGFQIGDENVGSAKKQRRRVCQAQNHRKLSVKPCDTGPEAMCLPQQVENRRYSAGTSESGVITGGCQPRWNWRAATSRAGTKSTTVPQTIPATTRIWRPMI